MVAIDFGNGIVAGGTRTDDVAILGHSGLEYPAVEMSTTESANIDGGIINGSRAKMREMTLLVRFKTLSRQTITRAFSPGVSRTLSSERGSMPYTVERVEFREQNLRQPYEVASISILSPYAYPLGEIETGFASSAISSDGITGDRMSNPVAMATNGTGTFVIVGSDAAQSVTTQCVAVSTDAGDTWEYIATPTGTLTDVAYGNGRWVVTSSTGLYYSDALSTWTQGLAVGCTCAHYADSKWVAAPKEPYQYTVSSTTAASGSWTAPFYNPGPYNMFNVTALHFLGGIWYAAGYGTHTIASSSNGTTWTLKNILGLTSANYGTAFSDNGSSRLVLTTIGKGIWFTDNFVTWTNRFNGSSFTDIDFASGRFYATERGFVNTILTSADGSSWSGLGRDIFWSEGSAVVHGDGVWVFAGGSPSLVAKVDTAATSIIGTGDVDTYPTVRVTLGTNASALTVTINGVATVINGSMTAGQVVTINAERHTVYVGTTNRLSWFDRASAWPVIRPGQNTVAVDNANSTTALEWYPRRMGLL